MFDNQQVLGGTGLVWLGKTVNLGVGDSLEVEARSLGHLLDLRSGISRPARL